MPGVANYYAVFLHSKINSTIFSKILYLVGGKQFSICSIKTHTLCVGKADKEVQM